VTERSPLLRLGRALAVFIFVAAGIALQARVAHATDTLVFTPVVDTYVDSSLPTSSFGTATGLWADATPAKQAFLRFQITGTAGRTITDVRLRLYQTDGTDSGGRVWSISNNSWSDSITWGTKPAIDGSLRGTFGPAAIGQWYEIDLGTSVVAGDGAYSFAIDSGSTDGSRWGSAENSNPAQIEVDLAAQQTPSLVDKFSFTPVADTYVDASYPTSSFGAAGSFWADNSPARIAFMRFQLSGLSGRTVVDTRLVLHQVDASSFGGRVFKISSNSWTESATWGNRPAIDGPELGSFGPVEAGKNYEIDLGAAPVSGDGSFSLAVDSVDADGSRWSSRESADGPRLIVSLARVPGLVIDGLTQIVGPKGGSSEPSYYASNHRMALTANGRILVVYGHHASGVQLAWRDPGGGWQLGSQGSVTDGQLLSGTGTGDWPASIAVARDSSGSEDAWAVFSRASFTYGAGVYLSRMSNLNDPAGPSVGPQANVHVPQLADARPDIAFERQADGSYRGVVAWAEQTGDSWWQIDTVWFTNLDTATPTFSGSRVLAVGTGTSPTATLVPTPQGVRLVMRGDAGALQVFGHSVGTSLTSWWKGDKGTGINSSSKPSATSLSDGSILAAVESDVTKHVVKVQRFGPDGKLPVTQLALNGYLQPSIASDGTQAWLVMVRAGDGYVVSRSFNGTGWSGADRVEIGPEGGLNYSWPNAIRTTDGRLRLLVKGPAGGTTQNAVLAYQRTL
jgi:hypothetical protein